MVRRRAPISLAAHRRLVIVSVVIVALITIVGITGWLLASATPAWFKLPSPSQPAVRQLAGDVENGLTTLLNEHRAANAEWSMSLKEDAACAWLAARLPAWVEHELGPGKWPRALRGVQARFQDQAITLALLINTNGQPTNPEGDGPVSGRVVSFTLALEIDTAGALWLRATSASIGLLPVPVAAATSAIGTPADERARNLLSALTGDRPLLTPADLPLADGRRVRIIGATAENGTLRLRCRTLTNGEATPR